MIRQIFSSLDDSMILKAFLVISEIHLSAFTLGPMLSALCPVAWISMGQHIILISRELS